MIELQALAWVIAILISLVAVLHVCLAAGQPLGEFAWGGQHRVLPARLRAASLAATFVLAAAVWIATARAGMLPPGPDHAVARTGVWVFTGLFALNTLGNLISKSATERYGMTPPTIVLTLCFLAMGLAD